MSVSPRASRPREGGRRRRRPSCVRNAPLDPRFPDPAGAIELVQRADELGFHRYWIGEHHSQYRPRRGFPPSAPCQAERGKSTSTGLLVARHLTLSCQRAILRIGGSHMPDKDVVERNLRGPWRAVYRVLKGGQPVSVYGGLMLKALAAQLRLERGLAALEEMSDAVTEAASRQGSARTLAETTREIERRFGFSPSARGTAAGALRLLGEIEAGQALPGGEALAVARCWEILERNFFGRLQRFVGPQLQFPDFASVDQMREACRSFLASGIQGVARRLANDPEASHLRAPASLKRRPVTPQLLEEPL